GCGTGGAFVRPIGQVQNASKAFGEVAVASPASQHVPASAAWDRLSFVVAWATPDEELRLETLSPSGPSTGLSIDPGQVGVISAMSGAPALQEASVLYSSSACG